MTRENPPYLFHFAAAGAVGVDEVARSLYRQGAVVIADPSHLPPELRPWLYEVSTPVNGEVTVTVAEINWTTPPIDWDEDDLGYTAETLVAVAKAPGDIWDDPSSLPEGTPERVLEWLGLDEDEGA